MDNGLYFNIMYNIIPKKELSKNKIRKISKELDVTFEHKFEIRDVVLFINSVEGLNLKVSKDEISIENNSTDEFEDKQKRMHELIKQIINVLKIKENELQFEITLESTYETEDKIDTKIMYTSLLKIIDKDSLNENFKKLAPVPIAMDFIISFDEDVCLFELKNQPNRYEIELTFNIGFGADLVTVKEKVNKIRHESELYIKSFLEELII